MEHAKAENESAKDNWDYSSNNRFYKAKTSWRTVGC